MRNAFAAAITDLAATDERIVLLSGDIGNRLFDKYRDRCPDRFYNCGVAEANMTGMAAGLALSGLRPFTYTITPFATTRVIEQIRVDICYHDVPVVIVGTGSGLSYASLGPTHHSCEDVGILRCFPNLTVLCPADSADARRFAGPAGEHQLDIRALGGGGRRGGGQAGGDHQADGHTRDHTHNEIFTHLRTCLVTALLDAVRHEDGGLVRSAVRSIAAMSGHIVAVRADRVARVAQVDRTIGERGTGGERKPDLGGRVAEDGDRRDPVGHEGR